MRKKLVYNMGISSSSPPVASSSPDRSAQILTFLEEADGWCSGEDLSRHLGISRAAISKHVASLRHDGHAIAAATRRGYRLLVKHEPLTVPTLTQGLETRIFGQAGWTLFEETSSTSHEAVRQAMDGMSQGSIIFAERQTRGRGRKGHNWFSAPRGLQFSLVLRPDPHTWDADILTELGVLAVAESLKECGFEPHCKLPNDVLLQGRKVAGVLAETGFRGAEPEWAVLGIGCNINALPEEFPEDLRAVSTSLLAESGRVTDRAAVLRSILEHLEDDYLRMQRGELDVAALRAHFSR